MYISQQLTVLIYDVLSILVLTIITSSFLLIETSYHSQKLSDISKVSLVWKLPKLFNSNQVDKKSWLLLLTFLLLTSITSFLTTILNSATKYTTQFASGDNGIYSVPVSQFNTSFNLGQQCSNATGELMGVNCLYDNLSGLLYLSSDNSTNSIGIIGTQFENITGMFAYSDNTATTINGPTAPGISTSAGNLLLPGLAGMARFVYSGIYGTFSNDTYTTYEFVMNGTSPFFTTMSISEDVYSSWNTEIGDPFTSIAASSISQLGFYNAEPDGTTCQNTTYQTLEYFYGNQTDVTMIMTTTHTFTGALNNITMATAELLPLNSFSGMASSISAEGAQAFKTSLDAWNTTTAYVMAFVTNTLANNSVCYEIMYATSANMIHSVNCWTVLTANVSSEAAPGSPAYVAMRPVINTRFGSRGYDLQPENCKYGAGPGPQYYDYKDVKLQNVLLSLASQGNRSSIAIPIITGASITGNFNGLTTVIALCVTGIVAIILWLIGRRRLYAAPLIDVLLNTSSMMNRGENFINKLTLDANARLAIDNNQIFCTHELLTYDSKTDLNTD